MKRRDFLLKTTGVSTALGAAMTSAASHAAPIDASPASLSHAGAVLDPAYIDPGLDSRSISFENPDGARGGGGKAGHGRKGRPSYVCGPGERLVLADIKGPGTIRHIWMTILRLRPEMARALRFEVFYDGASEPSISVPVLDFYGLPHGRVVEYYSALTSINEGQGLNAYIPMPFLRSLRAELVNESARHVLLYYQIDYTLQPLAPEDSSYLHASFRRENPTRLRQDFVIADGLSGPGRFLGCSVGVRVLNKDHWYGEGEVKIYRDGDREFPTYCGTGLEDYVGSAWNLGRHSGLYSGAPLNLPAEADSRAGGMPDLSSFYRWHIPDPVMFSDNLRVTIQQIGSARFLKGQEAAFSEFAKHHAAAGEGWATNLGSQIAAIGLFERSDDFCATAFVYCRRPQAVPRYTTDNAVRDMALLPGEEANYKFADDEAERYLATWKRNSAKTK